MKTTLLVIFCHVYFFPDSLSKRIKTRCSLQKKHVSSDVEMHSYGSILPHPCVIQEVEDWLLTTLYWALASTQVQ